MCVWVIYVKGWWLGWVVVVVGCVGRSWCVFCSLWCVVWWLVGWGGNCGFRWCYCVLIVEIIYVWRVDWFGDSCLGGLFWNVLGLVDSGRLVIVCYWCSCDSRYYGFFVIGWVWLGLLGWFGWCVACFCWVCCFWWFCCFSWIRVC